MWLVLKEPDKCQLRESLKDIQEEPEDFTTVSVKTEAVLTEHMLQPYLNTPSSDVTSTVQPMKHYYQ